MLKVKTFSYVSNDSLDRLVNNFLNNNNNIGKIRIIEMQYDVARGVAGIIYSMMIYYEELEQ